ncbi:hypothetical protein MKD41_11495 [Lutibacter sp. A64]|uniref:hypothetical protein n=1 Tax=Lutibacter sp. A64 TaxID=2918526 RepID=UPI001F065610|nr:hypothetical protein [Lutibacter sp. A64]UMB52956.1 hypothetical protein MKD41_11495 [Lutibacter sp. A64]
MTESLNIEKFSLSYKPTKSGEVSFHLKAINSKKNEALKYPNRLLYIVLNDNTFLYVGEAKAALKTRFQRSFGSYRHFIRVGKARGGYKGYKWIELLDPKKNTPKELKVWAVLFPASYNSYRDRIEAIEGELVWEIRKRTKHWPTFQNEIHFNNDYKDANRIANKILNEIK